MKFTETSKETCKIDVKLPELTGKDGQFKYIVLPNGKIQITRFLGSGTELVIPGEYDGYQVNSVGIKIHQLQKQQDKTFSELPILQRILL